MKLSRANYETYLIDYLDGKLKPLEVANLLLFLEQNPDIKAEFEGIELTALTEIPVDLYPNKETLKKKSPFTLINHENASHFLVRKIEQDLANNEIAELDLFLTQNNSFKKELSLFEKTLLKPDLSIQFPDKNSLKRQARIIPLFYRISAVAALLLLLVSIPMLIRIYSGNSSSEPRLASRVTDVNQAAKQLSLNGKKADHLISVVRAPTQIASVRNKVKGRSEKTIKNQLAIPPTAQLIEADSTKSLKLSNLIKEQTTAALIDNSSDANTEFPINLKVADSLEIGNTSAPFNSIKSIAEQRIKAMSKDNLEELAAEQTKKQRKINAWDFAAIGAKLVGKVSGKNIRLQNRYNSDGQLIQYAIVTNNFEFSRGH